MLTLTAGASCVVVAPEAGGALTGWMIGRTSILRRALPQAAVAGDPHAMGCFPLVPYGNRIAQGRFHWRGTDYRLKRNFGDHPHSIHGVGWQRAWQVAEVSRSAVLLTLDHRPDSGWPFPFQARLGYRLSAAALTVTIELTSRHHAEAPAGIGIHPFFPRTNDPTLRFAATGAWQNGADSLPFRHDVPPANWRHEQPRPIADSRLDNCFTGWGRNVGIDAGPASLRIEADDVFRQLQVFTPFWADFFCCEPVSHAPDAVNRPELPPEQAMHVLQPGQTLQGTIRLAATEPRAGGPPA